MNFVRLWGAGYVNPRRFVDELASKRAPDWGLAAQLLRARLTLFISCHLLIHRVRRDLASRGAGP